MKKEEMEQLTNSMIEKLGKDASGKIADDIATLLTDNKAINDILENKDNEINTLKKEKENLLNVNGNLLQKISIGTNEPFKNNEEKEDKAPKIIDYRQAFDEFRKF